MSATGTTSSGSKICAMTGRPPRPWLITFEEAQQRYAAGESLESVALACGFAGSQPVRTAFHRAGVPIRQQGPVPGTRQALRGPAWQRVCENPACGKTYEVPPSKRQRYCSPACRYACPKFRERLRDSMPLAATQHAITEADPTTRTGTCSQCGKGVDVRLRAVDQRYPRADGQRNWRCRNATYATILTRQYGLSLAQYNEMLDRQHGRCAICREPFHARPAVDHDHASGRVRGLLCTFCNTGIGLFRDDPARLRSAIEYLETP